MLIGRHGTLQSLIVNRFRSQLIIRGEGRKEPLDLLDGAQTIEMTAAWRILLSLSWGDACMLSDAFIRDPFLPFRKTCLEISITEEHLHEERVISLMFACSMQPDGSLAMDKWMLLRRESEVGIVSDGRVLITPDQELRWCKQWELKSVVFGEDPGKLAAIAATQCTSLLELLRARQVRIAPPPRHIRRAVKREQRPVDWHTVYIEPHVTKRLSEARLAARDGDGLRLHMVRGHEADYTQGRGLFGKWRVKVKVREHWRGDPERGILFTDRWVITDGKAS